MIRILGGLVISEADPDDTGRVPALDRKARELLALLVLHSPTALGAEELAGLLWEEPPPSALRTLRSHVSRIRSALEDLAHPRAVVSVRGDFFRLGEAIETDVAEVARLRRIARQLAAAAEHDRSAARLRQARDWWRGQPVLPATTAGQALQTGWDRERRLLIHEHLGALVAGSRPQDALAELASRTASDPLDEPSWVLYTLALHRSGRQADALAAAAAARRSLAEIGLDPGSELAAAQAAVLAGPAVRPDPRRDRGLAHQTDSGPVGAGVPPVRYTHTGDTAYIELSSADVPSDLPPVLILNPAMITIDGLLDESHVRAVLTHLAAQVRVLCLDRRGIGLSAPLEPTTAPLDQWVDDVRAVIGQADLPRPVLLANFDTGLVALEYAARHPDVLAGLVLVNCYAKYQRGADYPHGFDAATTTELISAAVDPNRRQPLDTSVLVAPSMAGDPAFKSWWNRIGQRGANPTTARIIRETATTTDLRARLPQVTHPVLVIPRRHCANVDPGHSSYLAAHLAHAQLTPVDGTDGIWFTGGSEIGDHVITFLSTLTSRPISRTGLQASSGS